MRPESAFRLRFRTLILAVLVPSLLAVTVVMGWLIYDNLRGSILAGFDRELSAISTVNAAFVDADDHAEILRPRELSGIAWDPSAKTLWGIDRARGELLTIDPATGGALRVGAGNGPVSGLARDPSTGRLWSIGIGTGDLLRIDPANGAAERIGPTEPSCLGLAWDRVGGQLLCSGSYLFRLDPATGRATAVGPTGFAEVSGLAVDPKSGDLLGTDRASGQLVRIDRATGKGEAIGRLEAPPAEPEEGQPAGGPVPQPAGALAVVDGKLMGASDRLFAVDAATGRVDPGESVPGFRNEESPLYLKYVAPMRRIREKKGITFIYSQVLDKGQGIQYVLDGGFGDAHSNIGAEDEIPDSEIRGIRDVLARETIYLSGIKAWEQWGLLKSGFAPIYTRDGVPVAMAGADVNISIIRNKTRAALARVGAMSVVVLLVAGFLSFRIARALTRPIAEVKDAAIQVAAGQYGHRIAVNEPRELAELASAFNDMSRTLAGTVSEINERNRAVDRRRARRELARMLARAAEGGGRIRTERIASGWTGDARVGGDGSGSLSSADGHRLLAWIAPVHPDPVDGLRIRGEVSVVARRLLTGDAPDDEILAAVEGLFTKEVRAFVLVDGRTGTARARVRGKVEVLVVSAEGKVARRELDATKPIALAPGETLVVASGHELPTFDGRLAAGGAAGLVASLEAAKGGGGGHVVALRRGA